MSERAPIQNMLPTNQSQNQTQFQNPNQAIKKQSNKPTALILPQARNVNLCDLDDTSYYPE
ncbi:2792_t:CDS:1, partial [Gigaspora margarita]